MRTPRGLSFVEMLVAIAIFGIIMIALVNSILFFYRANTSSLEQGFQVEHARRGAELLVRDVREATYADTGAYPLATVASSSIIFYSDTDLDGAVERIRYSLIGTRLYRNVTDPSGAPPLYAGGGATSTVSEYVRNFDENVSLFRYHNASSTEVTDSALINTIVSVTVHLIVDIVQKHTPGTFTLSESATLRNLRAQ
jgi:prepilin-type N-terminal cleavage/methylation domain-containing protein